MSHSVLGRLICDLTFMTRCSFVTVFVTVLMQNAFDIVS